MDDNLSIKSSDSVTISGEYEIVNEDIEPHTATLDAVSPALKIANNGDHRDLEKNLTEMIYETEQNPIHHNVTTESGKLTTNKREYRLLIVFIILIIITMVVCHSFFSFYSLILHHSLTHSHSRSLFILH